MPRPTPIHSILSDRWPRLAALLLVLSGCLFSGQATAQDEASSRIAAEVEITERARELFRAGVDFLQDPDGARYGEAYRSFKAAYAESPSWKILGNLGISAMKLERDGEAIEALETYLREGRGTFDEEEVQQVERDLRTLKSAVSYVTLSVTESNAILEDIRTPLSGQPVSNRYELTDKELRIGIHNGRHKFTLKKDGYQPISWSFMASGDELSHHFELLEVPAEPTPTTTIFTPAERQRVTYRPVPTVTWVTLGTTAAFAIGATVTGILALDTNSKYDAKNGTGADDVGTLRDRGSALNLTTDVLLGATLASALVATITFVTRPRVEVAQDTGFSIVPSAARGGGGLVMMGRF